MPQTAFRIPVFEIPDLPTLRDVVPEIRAAVAREDVSLIRGLVSPDQVRDGLAQLQAGFDPSLDTNLDHKSRVKSMTNVPNYQRLMLGEWGETETEHAMFMRCFYNPLHAPDIYGMHDTFRTLTRVRNLTQGVDESFCLDHPENGVYTLSRIHQYPSGGGFLKSHIDSTASAVPERAGLDGFIQILLVMSEKGKDFSSGGGYFVREGKRILYEDDCHPGDVLIYNGNTLHGVQSVDPAEQSTLHSSKGRYSALVTLYRIRTEPRSMG